MPFAVYESLPYFYLVVGAAAALGIEAAIGQLCGGLLFMSGCLVLRMRIQYRRCFAINTAMITRFW